MSAAVARAVDAFDTVDVMVNNAGTMPLAFLANHAAAAAAVWSRCIDIKGVPNGMIAVHDLANTGSVAAVQTADLGRRIEAPGSALGAGFDVLGRSAGAEERGCSIAVDAMLGGR